MKKLTAVIGVVLLVCSGAGHATESATVERGKELFTGTTLGTSGTSCASCHPGGKDLEFVGTRDDEQLGEIVNRCIRKALKGKALDEDGADMKSLIMYLRSVGAPR